jgi:elongation factor G
MQELGANFNVGEIPEQYKAEAEEWHEKLIEKAVEVDDAAMEAYFEGEVSR